MSVTIKDVSNHAGVSIKTVSRVINNEENVAEATKSKVLASVEKLGFKPNKSAQSLRSKRSYMIALLYDNPNKSYLADIQNGILQVCKKTGYNLVLQECDYEDKNLSNSIINFVEDFKIDGVPGTGSQILMNFNNLEGQSKKLVFKKKKNESFGKPFKISNVEQKNKKRNLLTIETADSPGLLVKIAKTLHENGTSIYSARINTLGDRVEDTFEIEDMTLSSVSSKKIKKISDSLKETM